MSLEKIVLMFSDQNDAHMYISLDICFLLFLLLLFFFFFDDRVVFQKNKYQNQVISTVLSRTEKKT